MVYAVVKKKKFDERGKLMQKRGSKNVEDNI